MIAKIAVSAALFAIDKPYSYKIPEGMTLQPGQRVQLPFGRANKRTEGVVLTVETGSEEKLKAVERCLDEAPILSEHFCGSDISAPFMSASGSCSRRDCGFRRGNGYLSPATAHGRKRPSVRTARRRCLRCWKIWAVRRRNLLCAL